MSKPTSTVKRRYNNKAYDRFTIFLKSGQKEKLKQIAAEHSMSLNELLNTSIKEYLSLHFQIELEDYTVTNHDNSN